MKNIRPFGPTVGRAKVSKKFLNILNKNIAIHFITNMILRFIRNYQKI